MWTQQNASRTDWSDTPRQPGALKPSWPLHRQHAGEVGEMRGRAHILAILGVDVGDGWMGRSTPGTIVDRIRP